jgi:hypothetical protein
LATRLEAAAAGAPLRQGARYAFEVGSGSRFAFSAGAGAVGNAGASVLGQLINNIDPYQKARHGATYQLGFLALVGGALGGVAGVATEVVALRGSPPGWTKAMRSFVTGRTACRRLSRK